jgi:hemolysin III
VQALDPPDVVARPSLRGVLHQWAFFASLIAGALLVALAPTGRAALGASIYAVAVAGLLGTSALYHRVTWSPVARRRMRRLDHAMIFVLIAGTYTPIAMLALSGDLATTILVVVWAGAAVGAGLEIVWVDAPKPLLAGVAIALGWVAVVTFGDLVAALGAGWVSVVAAGGLLYTAGAVIYARERPNPVPGVFGYHELFHALVVAAVAAHYAVIAFAVVPRG